MTELRKQLESQSYLKALTTTESIEAPALGFSRPSDSKSTFEGQKTIIKQNNTLLALIISLHQQLQEVQEQLQSIKRQQQTAVATPSTSKELETSIEELTKRIGGLNLGTDPIIPKKKGSILVFKNPSDILRKERAK